MGARGEIEIAVSEAILNETLRVQADKFKTSPEGIETARRMILSCAKLVTPGRTLTVVPSDADDNRIIECAIAAGSEAIVTGDNDLLRMGSYEGIRMMRIQEFLQSQQEGK